MRIRLHDHSHLLQFRWRTGTSDGAFIVPIPIIGHRLLFTVVVSNLEIPAFLRGYL